ncbi:MAG: DUF2490 domain-containing protein [Ginsengibacter sp.]
MITGKHIAFIILLMPAIVKAQHTTRHYNVLWVAYNNTLHFNTKWSLVNDAQVRTTDWANKWLLYAVRSGLSYNVNKRLAFTSGFTLFRTAQYNGKDFFFKNEWRPYEEVSYNLVLNRTNFYQRLRTEQRFLQQTANNKKTNDYTYIFRLRYRFEWQFPLKENIKLLVGNEVFINPGYINNTLFFDQNRTFAGLNFKLNSHSVLQSQYIKIFQWRSTASVLEDQNVIRINFVQQFNLKRSYDAK